MVLSITEYNEVKCVKICYISHIGTETNDTKKTSFHSKPAPNSANDFLKITNMSEKGFSIDGEIMEAFRKNPLAWENFNDELYKKFRKDEE